MIIIDRDAGRPTFIISHKIIFEGTRQEQCILVGNAVPVQLAKILGKSIKESLDSSSNKIARLNTK